MQGLGEGGGRKRLGNSSLHPVSHYKPGTLWIINLPQAMTNAAVEPKLRSVVGINNMGRRPLGPYFVDMSVLAQEMDVFKDVS